MIDMTVIILTRNEEDNIERCINSIKDHVKRVVVLDSYSTDSTLDKAKALGADIYQHEFKHYGAQFQYGIDNCDIKTKWIFRLDADEEVSPETCKELETLCKKHADTDVNGFVFRLNEMFMNKQMKHGGLSVLEKLCIFKTGTAYMEDRYLGEQLILTSGRSVKLKTLSYHYNYRSMSFWINKFNWYTTREVKDYFIQKENENKQELSSLDTPTKIRRFIKYNIYYKLPSGMRTHMLFIYFYYIKLGFLDGREGLYWNFFLSYFYRMLVDAKMYEVEKLHTKIGETGTWD